MGTIKVHLYSLADVLYYCGDMEKRVFPHYMWVKAAILLSVGCFHI